MRRGTWPPRDGNTLEVLIDGPRRCHGWREDMAAATSHVHLTGWFLSPELQPSREEEPLVVRTLLAELAERIDVRVLLWKGAPIPLFRPSRGDVREVQRKLTRHTKIKCAVDACTGASHCHHEKTIVIDDRMAYVGGIDLTIDGGDPYDTSNHRARGGIGWHDAAVRIEGPAVRDVAEHFRLRWHGATAGAAARCASPSPPVTSSFRSSARCRQARIGRAKGDYSILESYIARCGSAEQLVYLENQFLWSPEIVDILAGNSRARRPTSSGSSCFAGTRERRSRHLARSGGGAHRRRRGRRPLPRLHGVRPGEEACATSSMCTPRSASSTTGG